MVSDEPRDGRCGAHLERRGGYCERWPTKDSDGSPINGRCPNHGGVVGENHGPPKGSANYFEHGATAAPLNLLENDLLEEEDVRWIQGLVDAYLREAPFGPDSPKVERLTRTCCMIFQEWSGQRHILEEGMAVEDVVGVTDQGEPVLRTDEHYLCQRIDRLNDKIRMNLKDLGLLDDPDSQRAGAEQDKVSALRSLMHQADDAVVEDAEEDG